MHEAVNRASRDYIKMKGGEVDVGYGSRMSLKDVLNSGLSWAQS